MDGSAQKFTWDAAKSEACRAGRGFDFAFATRLFDGPVFEQPDDRRDYGELRVRAIGQIEGRLFVVVYTQRAEARHIISARRAHRKEFEGWPK